MLISGHFLSFATFNTNRHLPYYRHRRHQRHFLRLPPRDLTLLLYPGITWQVHRKMMLIFVVTFIFLFGNLACAHFVIGHPW